MDFLMKIPDVVEVEDKDGEITLLRPTPMQCDSHVKELVANQVSVRVSWDLLCPLRRYAGRGGGRGWETSLNAMQYSFNV